MMSAKFQDPNHSRNIDIKGLQLALKIPEIKIYSISEDTPLNEYLSLAPIINTNSVQVEKKDDNALADLVPLSIESGGQGVKLFRAIGLEPEYLEIKETFWGALVLFLGKIIKDTWTCIKILFRMFFKSWKIPFLIFQKKKRFPK